MRTLTLLSTLAAVALGTAALAEPPMSLHELKTNRLNGKQESLSDYKGKVLLVVNTASECGYTPQYAGLEKLYQEYKDKGVVVLGFPSNDFGGQEPGTSTQIAQFCERKFKVTFPMFEKVKTTGEGRSPVYEFLGRKHGEPKWNFHKYVVGKDGQVKAAFPSSVTPESTEVKKALDSALKE
ncbi:MAG TPA: glutathione peroxidase [Myxococcaceae bacterium]|jgi:glutathione peroxidase